MSKSLRESVENGTDIDGVIDYELKKQKKLLNEIGNTINVNFTYPSSEQVRTSALFSPVTQSMTFESYLDGIESGLYNVWDSNIRTGYLTGMTTQQIVKNVLGSASGNAKLADAGAIHTFRNSLYAKSRTVLQSFANETRNEVYRENEKYFSGYKYLATLDSRTCISCANFDGKIFKSIEEAPQLPQHLNCRCLLLAVVKGYDDYDDTRASANGYVSDKVTYSDWLKDQSDEVQKDVLGKTRYEMYKKGYPMTSFVENGKILTIKQLNSKLED